MKASKKLWRVWNSPSSKKSEKVDICTRYSSMQYLIVLFEPDESQIPMVMDRIFMEYYKKCDRRNFLFRDMSIDQYWKIKTGDVKNFPDRKIA